MVMTSPALRHVRANSGLAFRPDANTVLWLPGQDDPQSAVIRDRSGQGNDGTITGATWTRTDKGLWVLSADGADKVAVTPVVLTGEYTFLTWAYFDDTENAMIFGHDSEGGKLGIFNTKMFARAYNGGASDNNVSPPTTAKWCLLGLTRDAANKVDLYLNETRTRLFADAAQVGTLKIQNLLTDAGTNDWDGFMGLARILDRGMSSAEESGIYRQERGLFSV